MNNELGPEKARRLLFFRALRESDVSQFFISSQLMAQAMQLARKCQSDPTRLDAIAQTVESTLVRRGRVNPHKIYEASRRPGLMAAFPLCFLLGLCSNYLGDSSHVNILLNPLVTLVAWNVCVYVLLPLPFASHLQEKAGHLIHGLGREREPALPRDEKEVLVKTRVLFWRHLLAAGGPGMARSGQAFFHGLAVALSSGVVAGLYLRGLALDYDFVWRSTFVQNLESAATLLRYLFYPVYLIRGGLPPLEGENGAAWIHVFALTALCYIILPRLVLAAFSARRARFLRASLSVDLKDPFYLSLLAPLKGDDRVLEIISYSYTPPDATLHKLRSLLRTFWGGKLKMEPVRMIDWGEVDAPEREDPNRLLLLCFNGAQTPEEEVHGLFIEAISHQEAPTLILVDLSGLEPSEMSRKEALWASVLHGPILFFEDSLDEGALLSLLKKVAAEAGVE